MSKFGGRCDEHVLRLDRAAGAPAPEESLEQLDAILDALITEGSRSNGAWRTIHYQMRWWREWCARHDRSPEPPVSPRLFSHYLVSLVDPERHDPQRVRRSDGAYSVSSIQHAVTAMRAAHIDVGLPSPTDDPFVRNVITGAKRIARTTHGRPVQRECFDPTSLRRVVAQPNPFSGRKASLRWLRTKAWLLTAFHLNLRWQDWSALRWGTTLRRVETGWLVILADGKTRIEQDRKLLTPADDPLLCAVAALDAWAAAGNWKLHSLVFRAVKSPNGDETVLDSKQANKDLVAAFESAGLSSARLGTHSARRSFAVTAVELDGLDPVALAKAGGWATVRTAAHYANQVSTRERAGARQRRLESEC